MSAPNDLDALAEAYGILPSFHDLSGAVQPTSPETKQALLRANGLALDNDAMIAEALAEFHATRYDRMHPPEKVVRSGEAFALPLSQETEWRLEREGELCVAMEGHDGAQIDMPALPSGVHTLTVMAGGRTESITVIAAPEACPSVEAVAGNPRVWGVNAALYGLRSARNRGLGDFEDLARSAEAFAAHGAGFLGINPVHSIGWSERDAISPYSPSHRGFLNTWHIATDRIPGTLGHRPDLSTDESGWIQYQDFVRDHRDTLESLYASFDLDTETEFSDFCDARGEPLAQFALYEVLSESHGPDWRTWPAGVAAQDAPPERIRFHKWLQWLADTQLAGAQSRARQGGMGLGLYLDLAVGARRGGAESWCERDSIAQGVSLGAPPDHLSPDGQNWQLAAYAPNKLARQNYAPLRRIITETMRHAGVLRIDHVLGMNRSYWIPDDGSPGGYIRQPFEALLAIVAIEAERAGAVVIGEDLGLVPEGFREALGARGLYGYSVLQYERGDQEVLRHPDTLRPDSLLCFGTHDTPTMKGFWSGRDIDWWRKLDWIDDAGAKAAHDRRERDRQTLSGQETPSSFVDVRDRVHRAMATSPVAMVSVQLDDLCDHVEAQNLPGTINEHPNWRRRYAVAVERFGSELDLGALGETMMQGGRNTPPDRIERKVI